MEITHNGQTTELSSSSLLKGALGQSSGPTEPADQVNEEMDAEYEERRKRIEERRKAEQEADEARRREISKYSQQVRLADSMTTVGTNEWFTAQLGGMRRKADIMKLPYTSDQVKHWLAESFSMEVEMRGRKAEWESHTTSGIDAIGRWLTEDKMRWGLCMSGAPGIGKTVMAKSIRNVVKICRPNSEIMMANAIEIGGVGFAKSEIDKAKKVDVVIIDDLGLEPTTIKSYGNELSPITDIIYHRYDSRAMTIVTTNLISKWGQKGDKWVITEDPLLERYGSRIRDRFREMFYTIDFGRVASFRKEAGRER